MTASVGEIAVVALIALLVIKPEQLPSAALMVGRLLKTSRGLLGTAKTQLHQWMDTCDVPSSPNALIEDLPAKNMRDCAFE